MNEADHDSAAAMFEGDDEIWWVTGGNHSPSSTEFFSVSNNNFTYTVDLPKNMYYHNLVNVNHTHMVLLGGYYPSDEVYTIDRYFIIIHEFG